MKRVSRAQLRGTPLDSDCKMAEISKYESGPDDNRCFCYGLVDLSTELPTSKCLNCGAYAHNAENLSKKED